MIRDRTIVVVGVIAALALVLTVASGSAQQAGGPGLTIYTQNMALVRVTVDRTLQPGEHTVRVEGLPSNLEASSLLVLNDRTTLLGVHGRRSYQSAREGNAVSLELDLQVDAPLDELRLAYLTGGMGWSASYSMVVAPDDSTAGIDGYATIDNGSGAAFEAASVQLLAGTVNVAEGRQFRMMDAVRMEAGGMMPQAPSMSEVPFSGYHLYELDTPLDLHAGESRRVRLLGAASVAVTREYVLPGQVNYYQQMPEPQRQSAFIRYRVERPEGTELGDMPLPAGQVRVFQPDEAGRLQLLGVDSIPNTPEQEELLVTIGQAFDIVGTRTQTEYDRPGGDLYESSWEVELVNRSDEGVVVQVIEQIRGDWEILESSHDAQRLSAGAVRFDVPVPAGGEATLTYRVRVRS